MSKIASVSKIATIASMVASSVIPLPAWSGDCKRRPTEDRSGLVRHAVFCNRNDRAGRVLSYPNSRGPGCYGSTCVREKEPFLFNVRVMVAPFTGPHLAGVLSPVATIWIRVPVAVGKV